MEEYRFVEVTVLAELAEKMKENRRKKKKK
jgi:hypothetical protein